MSLDEQDELHIIVRRTVKVAGETWRYAQDISEQGVTLYIAYEGPEPRREW